MNTKMSPPRHIPEIANIKDKENLKGSERETGRQLPKRKLP